MLCKQVMKHNVECVSPEDPAQLAARKMRDENVGFLPVCDGSRKVLGTLTDRDLATRLVAENRPASTQVGDLMTPQVVSCRPTDDVSKAEQLMGKYQKSRIMCLDAEGRLAGVISLSDIVQRAADSEAAETMRQVTEREVRGGL